MTSTPEKRKPLSPRMRARLIQDLRELYEQVEADYPDFLETAQQLLPERAQESRFPFVIRCLWMAWAGEPPENVQKNLAENYKAFCHDFDWSIGPAPNWVTTTFLHRTLALYQSRYPTQLKADDALNMILHVGSLHKLLGGLE